MGGERVWCGRASEVRVVATSAEFGGAALSFDRPLPPGSQVRWKAALRPELRMLALRRCAARSPTQLPSDVWRSLSLHAALCPAARPAPPLDGRTERRLCLPLAGLRRKLSGLWHRARCTRKTVHAEAALTCRCLPLGILPPAPSHHRSRGGCLG